MRRIGTPTSVCPSHRFRFGGTLPLSPAGHTDRSTAAVGRLVLDGVAVKEQEHHCLGRLKGFFRRPF